MEEESGERKRKNKHLYERGGADQLGDDAESKRFGLRVKPLGVLGVSSGQGLPYEHISRKNTV